MHEFFAGSIFPVHPYRRERHSVKGIVLTGGVDRHISKQQPLSLDDLPGETVISDHISCKAGRSCQPPCPAVRTVSSFCSENRRQIGHFNDIRHVAGSTGIQNGDLCIFIFHSIQYRCQEITGVQGTCLSRLQIYHDAPFFPGMPDHIRGG